MANAFSRGFVDFRAGKPVSEIQQLRKHRGHHDPEQEKKSYVGQAFAVKSRQTAGPLLRRASPSFLAQEAAH